MFLFQGLLWAMLLGCSFAASIPDGFGNDLPDGDDVLNIVDNNPYHPLTNTYSNTTRENITDPPTPKPAMDFNEENSTMLPSTSSEPSSTESSVLNSTDVSDKESTTILPLSSTTSEVSTSAELSTAGPSTIPNSNGFSHGFSVGTPSAAESNSTMDLEKPKKFEKEPVTEEPATMTVLPPTTSTTTTTEAPTTSETTTVPPKPTTESSKPTTPKPITPKNTTPKSTTPKATVPIRPSTTTTTTTKSTTTTTTTTTTRPTTPTPTTTLTSINQKDPKKVDIYPELKAEESGPHPQIVGSMKNDTSTKVVPKSTGFPWVTFGILMVVLVCGIALLVVLKTKFHYRFW